MLKYERAYATATTIDFCLWELDGTDLKADATFAAGDVNIMKNEAAEAAAANLPTDEGQGYSLAFSAAEMTAARIMVYIVDQTSPKAWLDRVICIETYGHASAQHTQLPINVTSGVAEVNVKKVNDVTITGDGSATPFNVS